MKLNELVYWYQKKIGTYDKQQWEKTVEQHILGGFTHVPMRTTKLKTEFIDVDLVRGSSFPKAKPKHGLSTVACLALQRLLFLPLYRKWWIQQTSLKIFTLFLLVYSLQLISMCIYFCQMIKDNESDIVSTSEVLIPAIMMLTLCIVHSHIVSTHSGPTVADGQSKQKVVRRLRHTRCRMGKTRTRQNLHDDGFESLNGNVSSDNDKSATRVTVEKLKQKRDTLLKSNEERMLWLEDPTSQQTSQLKFSAPELLKIEDNSLNNELESSTKMVSILVSFSTV
ncbi:Putative homeodomain transcription factor [Habropoda laboriosa]|uniref:Putative homeodomain transcription factor n=1 Tax=Habropoda laboriosa TaxID=597456 RepID=A0A0L7R2C6_9HYME|nr:Putative homeodomain transcription factor [Habropoda laboriosa]